MGKYDDLIKRQEEDMVSEVENNIQKAISESIKRGSNYFCIDTTKTYALDTIRKCKKCKEFTHYQYKTIYGGMFDRFYFRNIDESVREIEAHKVKNKKDLRIADAKEYIEVFAYIAIGCLFCFALYKVTMC